MNELGGATRPAYRVELADVGYWRRQICCQDACPVHTDARGYVRAIASGDYARAYRIARGPNPLASLCGRVCGAPCEASCRRGNIDQPIAIRALKRFATERFGPESDTTPRGAEAYVKNRLPSARSGVCEAMDEVGHLLRAVRESRSSEEKPAADRPRVAVVGSGPAGLACAHDLALMGMSVVIYEAEEVPAGMLFLGIPEYRLPRDLIRAEIAVIEALGVEIRCSTKVGQDVPLPDLQAEYAAVVLAVGAKQSRKLDLPGADGPAVLGGVDFLRDVSLGQAVEIGPRVVVIGGGSVAYDVARTSLRQTYLDAARSAARQPHVGKVHLACLESAAEMLADETEVREGDEEGVVRHNRLGPVRIERDEQGRVRGVEFQRAVRVFDDEGRFSPQFDPTHKEFFEADTVILAVGQAFDFSFVDPDHSGVALTERGLIRIDPDTLATTAPGTFVAGDAAHGTRLMIDAIAGGKRAARSAYAHITGRSIGSEEVQIHRVLEPYVRELGYEHRPRQPIPAASVADRLARPTDPVEKGFDETLARCEAGRCLDCGVNTIFDGSKCVLCGGCVDVCPTLCLKLIGAEDLEGSEELATVMEATLGAGANAAEHSAIIKDEARCIRCANCAHRCPTGAITMERFGFAEQWT